MRINELLNQDLSPRWSFVWEIPEFKSCIGVQQNKKWHNESVDEHIRMVSDTMYDIVTGKEPYKYIRFIDDDHKKCLMYAALCHDLGKPRTTFFNAEDGQWHSDNHGVEGERITRNLFCDEPDIVLLEKVCWMTRWHMEFSHLIKGDDIIENRLENLLTGRVSVFDMGLLYYCDEIGCVNARINRREKAKETLELITSVVSEKYGVCF